MSGTSDTASVRDRIETLTRLGLLGAVLGAAGRPFTSDLRAGTSWTEPSVAGWIPLAAEILCWVSIAVGLLCIAVAALLWLDAKILTGVER